MFLYQYFDDGIVADQIHMYFTGEVVALSDPLRANWNQLYLS